ncbi:MAG: hypothetical protein DF168_00151 [Candidatus Moanabacter tarae]|uniref:Uncharacterized protein n=1 Tax=Candidatus Moanibacter tarae TaxID=2200854 RepID=A0A2Z4AAW4_9BACT|nr:MAG: hypothetical protein DF168_00151 [Candidatus Moanabacter tarae]
MYISKLFNQILDWLEFSGIIAGRGDNENSWEGNIKVLILLSGVFI